MPSEQTFVMVKPDGVARGLVGEIIRRLESKGLRLVQARLRTVDEDLAGEHYAEHRERPFFPELISFITGGPVMAMVWEGESAVSVARLLIGPTNPATAPPGTIRGDYGLETTQNLVHGSDSSTSATREIGLWFG
ncbi:MAG: nucleoside-diphosphate kinase [bacterium]|nr:nucleoside-diphosphate kinase [Acidimicrobiia bacterium]MCY4650411.1 nucleoside-diphosphate kinase [bacterium]